MHWGIIHIRAKITRKMPSIQRLSIIRPEPDFLEIAAEWFIIPSVSNLTYKPNNWGMALRRSEHADLESGSAGEPSGAGSVVPVRLKPHLPWIFELIQFNLVVISFL